MSSDTATQGVQYLYEYDASEQDCLAQCVARSHPDEASEGNFFKGAKWSPDGTMVAAHLEDNSLRLYDVSNAVSSFSSKEQHESAAAVHSCRSLQTICHGETLVDYAWYPYMSRYDPALCCLVESTRDHPLHLRDTNSGKVRASYVAYDSKDVLMTASAVAFSPDAGSILAGYNGSIARFDMQRPGLPVDQVATTPTRRSRDGMKGIVSCIAVSPATAPAKMVACGSFSGQMSLRSLGQLEASCIGVWPAPAEYGGRGVTQLKWSPDGMLLWVASRQSMHIVGWDVRDMRGPWAVVLRDSLTQQRMGFDLDATGRHIVAGEMDGCVAFHDIYAEEGQQQRARMRMHGDLVSDVCSHPYYPLLATTSGQRHFPLAQSSGQHSPAASSGEGESDGEESAASSQETRPQSRDSCLRVWSVRAQYFAKHAGAPADATASEPAA